MKQLTAILLLLLLVFNLMGYQLWFQYVLQKADTQFITQLDAATYNEEDLITLRVPLHMPYQTDRAEFERVDGEITLDGKIYKYVKRKIEAGHLVLLCLPDENKQQLTDAKHTYTKMLSEVDEPGADHKNAGKNLTFKSLWSEYDNTGSNWLITPPVAVAEQHFSSFKIFINPLFAFTPEQPPEQLLA